MTSSRVGWRQRVLRLQGGSVQFDLREYESVLAVVNQLEPEVSKLRDEALAAELRATNDRARAFAIVREASRRTLALRPFDVQVLAALAMDDDAIVEMQTGEGKTLAAVMPAAHNAVSGRGVHVLTFNDYLARRDAEWMAPIYRLLGLSVSFVEEGMTRAARRQAYAADVTYVTAKEAGFDYLRDGLVTNHDEIVHRPFHVALVDEADSILVDEARVPLVIAGSVEKEAQPVDHLAAVVASLSNGLHFDLDEYARNVELTDAGIEHVERTLGCGSLHGEQNYRLLTELHCALHARVLLRRDVDYIVRNGRVEIVDELTGRVVEDRHWPGGLQAALEAKEKLARRAEGCILTSTTLHAFLRRYERLCGMTGTAQECARELHDVYGLAVVVIPTHRPMLRGDGADVVFATREAKESALVREIQDAHGSGRPVLVGTLTVEESERLAGRLASAGVRVEVLNARNDEAEAAIVARAGQKGAITIATNMAGRGTDIRLGEGVSALGGLYVIGTNRHESHRVDRQLRGRAGRQGDPGDSRFFVSLEDDLLVRYRIEDLLGARFVRTREGEEIRNPVVRHEIARAQRIVDGQNFEIRRTLARYASVIEEQHRMLLERRQALLSGEAVPDVWQRAPQRRAALVAATGEDAVREAERLVTIFQIDRAWRDHLAFCADVREGVHLVRLGGGDPLVRFTREAIDAFDAVDDAVGNAVLAALDDVLVNGGEIDLSRLRLRGPSSTWTYLVNDDPFRNRIGQLLTGAGGATVAIYSAAVLMPLLILWGLVEQFFRRPPRRGVGPGDGSQT